ncbi:PREDICTED: uncharacterized protein LOC108359488 [Rhagoletis zephyria]|uniref:uncharacterized protein LOC108359488 n=1 Tax=Rhagoletis zephyria TaxID=28612 RepID=UPI0008114801|nr:PREDICTED: uncharacterized protein LOC108359488 [Rhagoletis zephyria]XP_017466860.1 PREDICTED: uncharacterized protein LOC108359488 [Rhagoletis zephyria]
MGYKEPLLQQISPQEEAMQSLCKQLLKSKIFRGYYEERRFVDAVSDYRDIIGLHRSEREFERLLLDIKCKLQLFYQHSPHVWIGITHGDCMGVMPKKYTLDTHIWLQLQEAAFAQYWFLVKSVRFRKNEVLLKLKIVRAVEAEPLTEKVPSFQPSTPALKPDSGNSKPEVLIEDAEKKSNNPSQPDEGMPNTSDKGSKEGNQIGYEDFVEVVRDWGTSIKQSVYDFISNDINKDNIKGFLQFLGLVVVSLLTGSFEAIKYLGTFALHFMFEFTRFTHIMTPIILKLIEMATKIVGGFYVLLAMIWKDVFMKRNMAQQRPLLDYSEHIRAIEYNRPLYKSIEYNIRQSPPQPSMLRTDDGQFTEFERKLQ